MDGKQISYQAVGYNIQKITGSATIFIFKKRKFNVIQFHPNFYLLKPVIEGEVTVAYIDRIATF